MQQAIFETPFGELETKSFPIPKPVSSLNFMDGFAWVCGGTGTNIVLHTEDSNLLVLPRADMKPSPAVAAYVECAKCDNWTCLSCEEKVVSQCISGGLRSSELNTCCQWGGECEPVEGVSFSIAMLVLNNERSKILLNYSLLFFI